MQMSFTAYKCIYIGDWIDIIVTTTFVCRMQFTRLDQNTSFTMSQETFEAARFLSTFISPNVSQKQRSKFVDSMQRNLQTKFRDHWYVNDPLRGQGYRCLRLHPDPTREPMIAMALKDAELNYGDIKLPLQLTMWVDPGEVSYRFGEDGSVSTLISFERRPQETPLPLRVQVLRHPNQLNSMPPVFMLHFNS